ncbi:hypothetical protein [Streptomyces sp. cmx-4-9]|uniref:hypothetical protein n=1 Tax=Streptomyces sp. cmx-4-9 TaxID=2790941 RepID=UPI00397F598C
MDTTRSPDIDINDANKPRKPDPDAMILVVQEVAYELRCSVRTVRRLIAEGAPVSRAGKRAPIRVHRNDLQYYYDMRRQGGRRLSRSPRTRAA